MGQVAQTPDNSHTTDPKIPTKEVKSGEAIRHNVSSLIKENRNQFTLFVISEGLNRTATARP